VYTAVLLYNTVQCMPTRGTLLMVFLQNIFKKKVIIYSSHDAFDACMVCDVCIHIRIESPA